MTPVRNSSQSNPQRTNTPSQTPVDRSKEAYWWMSDLDAKMKIFSPRVREAYESCVHPGQSNGSNQSSGCMS